MLSHSFVLLISVLLVEKTTGASLDPSDREAASVTALREVFKNLPEDYMKEDYWLANWLKSNEFSVEKAAREIQKHLKFRMDQKVEQTLAEDWTEMHTLFPYTRNTTDKSGRPVVYGDISKFDVASFVTTKETSDRLLRYLLMIGKESEVRVSKLRAEGRPISKFSWLMNFGGFSQKKHLCQECVNFYSKLADSLEPFVAAHVERMTFVNVPNLFKAVYFQVNKNARKLVHLHGQDQDELENMLLNYIDRDQIPNGILDEIVVKDNSEGFMIWDKEL